MSRFLIEISREYNGRSERQMEYALRMMGSHFVTHADWRLKEGKCTGTMIAELADRRAAIQLVPPALRAHAAIFELEPVTRLN